jgi:selenocysteine lyase/cysteine desulfurase
MSAASQETAADKKAQAYAAFLDRYPEYRDTLQLDELRAADYARLDVQGHVYLDYTGGGLYGESQLEAHMDLLRDNVFGNPHSHNPTSMAMTDRVESARAAVLRYFNASPDEYVVIFTPNASGALKLVGESYPFRQGGHFVLSADDHNSVNGIREFAGARGAKVTYVPATAPALRLDEQALRAALAQGSPDAPRLFAFPAQSNFSGVKHPLELIGLAREQGWDVLLDAAAYAPTSTLDLSRWLPDFVSLSFYKMFGYPTGVGALLARRGALEKLQRPWFAGGTIKIASVRGNGHYLVDGEAGFEDGTVNYLMLPAVEIGLHHLESIGMDVINQRVRCLTGWLLDELTALRHANEAPLVQIHGPRDLEMRGGTITFNLLDAEGQTFSSARIEQLAAEARISLRTGCFCNPGAGEIAYDLSEQTMQGLFSNRQGMSFQDLVATVKRRTGRIVSAIRISVGLASNFADAQQLIAFAGQFRDRTADAVGEPDFHLPAPAYARDAA